MTDAGAADSPARGTVADRIDRLVDGARLRILVVGAGIAGSTFAALLRRREEPFALIERSRPEADAGYMLGLMPLGGRVLNGLGLAEQYAAASVAMATYALYDRRGRLSRRYPLAPLVERFGTWRGVERGALVDLLRREAGPIVYEATITALADDGHEVTVTFDDGSSSSLDLVVIADGIHSATRRLLLAADEVEGFDTGWGGFVMWSGLDGQEPDIYSELWSAGWGVGLYPVPGRVGVFVGGPHTSLVSRDAHDYVEEVAGRLPPGAFSTALADLDRSAPGHYWKMADCRSKVWSRGRAVLLGDAAAGFLPTAGVGASAAMDSAAALADELSRADRPHLGYALELYERRQRPRVELAQKNSRTLARYMFVDRGATAFVRDQFMRFYTLGRMVSDITAVMDGR